MVTRFTSSVTNTFKQRYNRVLGVFSPSLLHDTLQLSHQGASLLPRRPTRKSLSQQQGDLEISRQWTGTPLKRLAWSFTYVQIFLNQMLIFSFTVPEKGIVKVGDPGRLLRKLLKQKLNQSVSIKQQVLSHN